MVYCTTISQLQYYQGIYSLTSRSQLLQSSLLLNIGIKEPEDREAFRKYGTFSATSSSTVFVLIVIQLPHKFSVNQRYSIAFHTPTTLIRSAQNRQHDKISKFLYLKSKTYIYSGGVCSLTNFVSRTSYCKIFITVAVLLERKLVTQWLMYGWGGGQ